MKSGTFSFLALVAASVVCGQSVNTTSGPVLGHAASNSTNVTEYLGIPYAKPPVGDLRFEPPEAYTGTDTINGTSFGFACLTTTAIASSGGTGNLNIRGANLTASGLVLLSTFGQIGDKFSEDCLTLNVWVPSGGETKKAVLLWIYGGGFNTGSSSTPEYNGQHLAAQEDVVVVSINYRLNVFGFPGNPSIPTQNLGLLDQRLAIEWTRDNIASFNGDSSRITLFGQSAGSASVDYQSYAYPTDPIAAGYILESGTLNGFGQLTAVSAAAAWWNVTSALNCGNATSANHSEVLTCMQSANATLISAAAAQVDAARNAFGPTVDEITVFSDYPSRSASGNFSKSPMLIGNNDLESGLFAAIDALSNITFPASYWDFYNRAFFTCPAGVRANISISKNVPTWRYRYFGEFPNTIITYNPDSGAWHTAEVPILFDTVPKGGSLPDDTTAEVAIGQYMRGAWAAFAKDPQKGLTSYGGGSGWPSWDPSGETLIRLAYMNLTGTNAVAASMYDLGCNNTFAVTGNGTASGGSGGSSSTSSGTGTATGTGTSATASSSKSMAAREKSWIGSVLVGMLVTILL